MNSTGITVIGHVEGGESGVGVAKHRVNCGVTVYAAPAAAGLPHPVQNSAYRQGVVAVLHYAHSRRPLLLLGRGRAHAPDRDGGSAVRS